MSDQRPDDENLGRALGRAVESQGVPETPFERSRLARRIERPSSPGWTSALPIAAALALFVAMGAFFATRGPQGGVATPDTSASPSISETTGPAPTPTAVATANTADAARVYFARDQLPPVSAMVPGPASFPTLQAAERISARVRALWGVRAPSGDAGNIFGPHPGGTSLRNVTTTITGDTATVVIDAGTWDSLSSAETIGVVGQLIYTITEEPGIRRAALREPGKDHMSIGTGILREGIAREDVVGYREPGSTQSVRGFGERGGSERRAATKHAVEVVPGLTRFEIEIAPLPGQPSRAYPDWNVSVARNDETLKPNGGKWRLTVQVDNASDPTTGFVVVDRTPLRSIATATGKGPGGVGQPGVPLIYELALDDLRPWRTALAFDPLRIIVEIGGHPAAISGRNSVTSPRPGETVGRDFTVVGIASAFEANVQYRVRDAQGRVAASGFTTATNCCEAGGLFSVAVRVPPEVAAGRITLEVFQGSPRDGSDLALISIPLQLR